MPFELRRKSNVFFGWTCRIAIGSWSGCDSRPNMAETIRKPKYRPAVEVGNSTPLKIVMALVVFLRGVNVGGYRTFRPSVLARKLNPYDVVNVGAAGTFVVRKPGPRSKFRAELLRSLPFETHVVLCDGREIIRMERENPFGSGLTKPDTVRFVSILSKPLRIRPSIPMTLPEDGEWLMKVIAAEGRFVFGVYRRHMKTIGYLGQIDQLVGAPATTRNWNTIRTLIQILKER
jgi:uncharacterized protein (DUF1697 family)